MTIEDVTLVAGVYIIGAVILSLLVAFRLDQELKARPAANRPYMWGFFFGCICIAYVPLAALSGVATVEAASSAKWAAYQVHGIYTLAFALNVVSGWSILRRKRWAWILGTLLSPICAFPVVRDLVGPDLAQLGFLGYLFWPFNYAYGHKRWTEFRTGASALARADHKPFEPARLLTSVEAKAHSQDVPTSGWQDRTPAADQSPALPIAVVVCRPAEGDTAKDQLPLVFGPQDEGRTACTKT